MIKTICALIICAACYSGFAKAVPIVKGETMMTIKIKSASFAEGGMIPARFTCDGADSSPPLSWDTIPEGAKSLALICDDPDAPMGTWVHWVAYNLPPTLAGLPEAVPPAEAIAGGGKQGVSDFGKFGYGGPCPPGGTHRYFFKLYALDTLLSLSGKVTKKQLEAAMKGHIIGEGRLMGKYSRP
jgi:Raf kinase inhibitor-like YbhB/YbcL family protein